MKQRFSEVQSIRIPVAGAKTGGRRMLPLEILFRTKGVETFY